LAPNRVWNARNFPWTTAALFLFLSAMAEPEQMQNLTSPVSLVIDAVLVIAFFAFMFWVVASHVPSQDPKMIALWGALTALCLTGVFWLALQMFKVVLRAQRESRRK
jgi:hypothetical protein